MSDGLSQSDQQIFDAVSQQHEDSMREQRESYAEKAVEQAVAEGEEVADEDEAKKKIVEFLSDHPDAIHPYLVRGAKLRCRCGTHIRKMNLPVDYAIYTGEGKHPLTVSVDNVPEKNIMYFGICDTGSITDTVVVDLVMENYDPENNFEKIPGGDSVKRGKQCRPEIIGEWQLPHAETRIVKHGLPFAEASASNSLTTASYLVCRFGGLIEPLTSGQENTDTAPIGG